MNRDEMVEGILRSSGISKANINRFYDGLVALAKKKLAVDGEFVFPGLGVLRVKVRKAREGRNPKTGEKIRIPRKKVVRFGAYKELKELINPGKVSSEPIKESEEQ
ncbi:MAG: HU family DNA-binding protein [Deltaproteobacteria bacterium]|nr:HU family DNA-binding protein [Deltaproteobacteria bacterium]MBW1873730.1 HU family DNA-binding protein [Deltaproteobacteria bacterium]